MSLAYKFNIDFDTNIMSYSVEIENLKIDKTILNKTFQIELLNKIITYLLKHDKYEKIFLPSHYLKKSFTNKDNNYTFCIKSRGLHNLKSDKDFITVGELLNYVYTQLKTRINYILENSYESFVRLFDLFKPFALFEMNRYDSELKKYRVVIENPFLISVIINVLREKFMFIDYKQVKQDLLNNFFKRIADVFQYNNDNLYKFKFQSFFENCVFLKHYPNERKIIRNLIVYVEENILEGQKLYFKEKYISTLLSSTFSLYILFRILCDNRYKHVYEYNNLTITKSQFIIHFFKGLFEELQKYNTAEEYYSNFLYNIVIGNTSIKEYINTTQYTHFILNDISITEIFDLTEEYNSIYINKSMSPEEIELGMFVINANLHALYYIYRNVKEEKPETYNKFIEFITELILFNRKITTGINKIIAPNDFLKDNFDYILNMIVTEKDTNYINPFTIERLYKINPDKIKKLGLTCLFM